LNLDVRNQILIVVSSLPNSPADKAGMKTGDAILKINNKDVPLDVTVQQANSQLRGAIGSKLFDDPSRGRAQTIDLELAPTLQFTDGRSKVR
jgi:C-terminal processing protease CtpA/Prc